MCFRAVAAAAATISNAQVGFSGKGKRQEMMPVCSIDSVPRQRGIRQCATEVSAAEVSSWRCSLFIVGLLVIRYNLKPNGDEPPLTMQISSLDLSHCPEEAQKPKAAFAEEKIGRVRRVVVGASYHMMTYSCGIHMTSMCSRKQAHRDLEHEPRDVRKKNTATNTRSKDNNNGRSSHNSDTRKPT